MRFILILAALTIVASVQTFASDELSAELSTTELSAELSTNELSAGLRAERRGWQCTAHGKLSTGGPGGGVWQTVIAHGPTEFEAMHNALQICHAHSLQMCTADYCSKIR